MEQIIEELHRCSGSLFDGDVVKCSTKKIVDFTPTEIQNTIKILDKLGMK